MKTPHSMTVGDFLYQAGFFQWVGVLTIISILSLTVLFVVAVICTTRGVNK